MSEVTIHLTGVTKQYQDEEAFRKLFPRFITPTFKTIVFKSGNVFITFENQARANKLSRFVTKHDIIGGKLKVCNPKSNDKTPAKNVQTSKKKPSGNVEVDVKNDIVKIIPSFSFKKLEIFDIEIDEEFAESFCCSICMFTFSEPSGLRCGHIFVKIALQIGYNVIILVPIVNQKVMLMM